MASSATNMQLREATHDEIDALAAINIAAMPTDPAWGYRLAYRNEYPSDHRRYVLNNLEVQFRMETTFIYVIEADSHPIALAVLETNPGQPLGVLNERDAHPERTKAFRSACVQLSQHLEETYSKRWHLRTLVTLPEYQNRGAGTKLCKHVIEQAKQSSIPLILFCSSEAKKLYTRLGFRPVSSAVARVEGDQLEIPLVAMSIES